MIQSKRHYKSPLLSFLMNWNTQFLLGFLLSVILAAVLAWGVYWQSWLTVPSRFNSLIASTLIYFFSFISLRNFLNYLGILNLRYVMPAILVWVVVGYGALFILRVPYSIYFLTYALVFMLLFFLAVCLIRNRYGEFSVGYIALGNLKEQVSLPNVSTVYWVKIDKNTDVDAINADVVVADLRANLGDYWEHFLAECTLKHIPVYHSSRLIESATGRVKIDHLYENDLGSLLPSKGYLFVKRIVDVVLVLASMPVVIPIMVVTSICIALESRGGVFFCQERIGEGGVPYTMYKFRSMYINNDTRQTQKKDKRITKVGRIIRKTRIDELPQFYNVLKGEMSLIGPRSEIVSFVDDYNKEIPFYNYRHIVKPGISGWAQVMHGYTADTEATKIKLEHDFYYIKNFSFSLDLLIFFKTIQTIFTASGAR